MKRVKRARRSRREGREAEKCPKKDETSGARQRERRRGKREKEREGQCQSDLTDNELGLDFVDPSQVHFGE